IRDAAVTGVQTCALPISVFRRSCTSEPQAFSTNKIVQKAWGSEVQDRLKTVSGEREVDLHPDMAGMLREFIGDRNSGLLFVSRRGRPLHQSSVLRRKLHPILAKLGQPKCGVHAFRRFRNTYLRNFTATPPGVLQFWMGRRG